MALFEHHLPDHLLGHLQSSQMAMNFLDHFLQLPLSPECQQVRLARNSRIREHPTQKMRNEGGKYLFPFTSSG